MKMAQLHTNQLGGYWVDVIEVTAEGNKMVDYQTFDSYLDAKLFWLEITEQAVAEMKARKAVSA